MQKIRWFILLWVGVLILGCGPDTIFVRPGIDTPSQHVDNGHRLLKRGKIEDACREFVRAKELDPKYVEAYVGLGVALAQKGDMEGGIQALDTAKKMAADTRDDEIVQQGYEQIKRMGRSKRDRQTTY